MFHTFSSLGENCVSVIHYEYSCTNYAALEHHWKLESRPFQKLIRQEQLLQVPLYSYVIAPRNPTNFQLIVMLQRFEQKCKISLKPKMKDQYAARAFHPPQASFLSLFLN
jgi:hypothetical protein